MVTYDGDDVAMLILASVAFLFPLHDGGGERTMLVEDGRKEQECVELPEGKDYKTGFVSSKREMVLISETWLIRQVDQA